MQTYRVRWLLFAGLAVSCLAGFAASPDKQVQRRLKVLDAVKNPPAALVGSRVYGEVEVVTIEPVKADNDNYLVTTVVVTERMDDALVKNRWVQTRCLLLCKEDTAIRLRKGRKMTLAGDVISAKLIPGDDKKDDVLELRLLNVQAR